jgi:hypothetical protein
LELLEYSKKRLSAFLEQVEHLKNSEFPYPSSRQALEEIESTFREHFDLLESLSSDSGTSTVRAGCSGALTAMFEYLPYLGFLLRSTNVRNGFEVYGPLLRLARKLLGQSTKLILSSEWDYSPYMYFGIPSLGDFVLIGLPAPESANPLLLPLAGHELGHAVWKKQDLNNLHQNMPKIAHSKLKAEWKEFGKYFPVKKPDDIRSDIEAFQIFEQILLCALKQCEETFCDLIGLRMFGSAYLHAFAYLLSGHQTGRVSFYPNMRRRASDMAMAAQVFGYEAPANYTDLFIDAGTLSFQPHLLPVIDATAMSQTDILIGMAEETVTQAGIPKPDTENIRRVYSRFKEYVVPLNGAEQLSCIVNAAWLAYHDKDLWKDRKEIRDRDALLKDLVLKNIEVLQIKEIMQEPKARKKRSRNRR